MRKHRTPPVAEAQLVAFLVRMNQLGRLIERPGPDPGYRRTLSRIRALGQLCAAFLALFPS